MLELSRSMTIRDVARHLNVGWDLIKEIQKRDLLRRYAKPKLKHVRCIAIDEIAVAKGHRYLTVVMDLESGAVVFVGDGKGADALKPFWKRLRPSKAKIEAVAMDISKAYWGAVMTHLPNAKVVFDHFHVIKLFNDKLSDLRRALYRETTEVMRKEVLKVGPIGNSAALSIIWTAALFSLDSCVSFRGARENPFRSLSCSQ